MPDTNDDAIPPNLASLHAYMKARPDAAKQLPPAVPLGRRQGQQRAKDGRRIKDSKFLARGEECGRFVEGFSVFDFGARNREMRIDLATIPRFWTG